MMRLTKDERECLDAAKAGRPWHTDTITRHLVCERLRNLGYLLRHQWGARHG